MNIVLTGGAGFLGSHLCRRFIKDKHRVICVDNFITGSHANINDLMGNRYFELIRHDIARPFYIDGKVDWVMHFASPASPKDYLKHPIKTIKVGTLGTHTCLGIAKAKKAKFFLASTSEVYGDPLVSPQPESYWGHVNPIGERSCFSSDTEVLTADGWKSFSDITIADNILTLHEKRNALVYQKPTDIIKQRYIGELIHFKNTKIDLLVTPGHDMYTRERDASKFTPVKAFESINWARAEFLTAGPKWEGKEREYFFLPPVKNIKLGHVDKIRMDDWLEFLGYYLSEGCVYCRNYSEIASNGKRYERIGYNVLIAQDSIKNKHNCKKIEACLKRLPFKFNYSNHRYFIANKQLSEYLQQFGKSRNRFVPTDLKSLSTRQLRILFNALMLGDGSKRGDAFYSSSLRLAGDFQEILLKLGMSGKIAYKDFRKKTPVYQIHIMTGKGKDFFTPQYPDRELIPYDGYVYCVTVPNRIIVVRRNGRCLFCGNCYDESKRAAEAMAFAYWRQHHIDIRVIRIFNTYGPRMRFDDGRVISNFVYQALTGKNITVYGKGSYTRSFCYVDDLVEGICRFMRADDTGPLNLGTTYEFSVLELAKKVIKLTGSKSKIVYLPLPMDDPKQRRPDLSKARKLLKWEPEINLDDGLKRTIAWFKKEIDSRKIRTTPVL